MGGSEPIIPTKIPEEPEEELVTPPQSPNAKVRFRNREDSIDLGETPRPLRQSTPARKANPELHPAINITTQDALLKAMDVPDHSVEKKSPEQPQQQPVYQRTPSWTFHNEKSVPLHYTPSSTSSEAAGSSIIEQAWMMKMANELTRRAREQKAAMAWDTQIDHEETPPPAYVE
jgi:distribution and morphology protein 34